MLNARRLLTPFRRIVPPLTAYRTPTCYRPSAFASHYPVHLRHHGTLPTLPSAARVVPAAFLRTVRCATYATTPTNIL